MPSSTITSKGQVTIPKAVRDQLKLHPGTRRQTSHPPLEKILMTEQFEIEGRDEVWSALDGYEKDRGDFSDYLIGRKNQHHGCSRTVTLDRSLKDDPTFELL